MKMTTRQYLFTAALVAATGLWSGTLTLPAQTVSVAVPAGQTEAESPEGKSNAVAAAMTAPAGEEKTVGIDRQTTVKQLVKFGRNVELKAGDSAEVVVVIGASAKVHGKVREAVVVIGGDIEVDGEVGDAVVAVGGSIHVKPGAKVAGDVVTVGGDLTVDANAKIHGDAVSVGGALNRAEGSSVKGEIHEVDIPFLASLSQWLVQCVFKMRPLAPQVGFVWVIAGVFFLFYLLVAAAFPQPVQKCVNQLDERPIATFLFGLLAKMLIPVVALILAVTGIGLLVVPFLSLAVFLGVVVGKIALLEWVGLRIGQQSGIRALQKPLIGFLLGWLILTLFYNVWVVGFIAYVLFGIWGLGVAVTAVIGGLRRRTPGPSGPVPPPPGFTRPPGSEGFPPGMTGQPGPIPANAPFMPSGMPGMSEVMYCPRAGFWERMAAGFLDLILVGILTALVHRDFWSALVVLAYFTGMWAWRGTTVGGIVLGLKVVRLDGHSVSFTVALVRSLSAAFSMVVLFLGFFWIAWDSEKQAWHDKIAGTVVVRVPRATPLVCV